MAVLAIQAKKLNLPAIQKEERLRVREGGCNCVSLQYIGFRNMNVMSPKMLIKKLVPEKSTKELFIEQPLSCKINPKFYANHNLFKKLLE